MHDPTDPPDDANGEIVRACPHGYPFGTPCEDCDAMAGWSWWNGKD